MTLDEFLNLLDSELYPIRQRPNTIPKLLNIIRELISQRDSWRTVSGCAEPEDIADDNAALDKIVKEGK